MSTRVIKLQGTYAYTTQYEVHHLIIDDDSVGAAEWSIESSSLSTRVKIIKD